MLLLADVYAQLLIYSRQFFQPDVRHDRKTFSSEGALGKAIPGFQARQPQIDMAEAVSSAIKDQTQLVVEAGTGTGKTFAYLVPALLSGKSHHQYGVEEPARAVVSS